MAVDALHRHRLAEGKVAELLRDLPEAGAEDCAGASAFFSVPEITDNDNYGDTHWEATGKETCAAARSLVEAVDDFSANLSKLDESEPNPDTYCSAAACAGTTSGPHQTPSGANSSGMLTSHDKASEDAHPILPSKADTDEEDAEAGMLCPVCASVGTSCIGNGSNDLGLCDYCVKLFYAMHVADQMIPEEAAINPLAKYFRRTDFT